MSTASHDDHDVVVVDRSGGGGGAATILGVIVIALLVVGIWFFAFGPGQGTFGGSTDQPNDINVNVELPSVAPAGVLIQRIAASGRHAVTGRPTGERGPAGHRAGADRRGAH